MIKNSKLISCLVLLVGIIAAIYISAFTVGGVVELREPTESINKATDSSLGTKFKESEQELPEIDAEDSNREMPGMSSAPGRLQTTIPDTKEPEQQEQITLTRSKSESSLLSKLGSKLGSAIKIFTRKAPSTTQETTSVEKPAGFDSAQIDLDKARQITPQAFGALLEKNASAIPDAQVRTAAIQAIRLSNSALQKAKILLEQIGKNQLVSEDAITSAFKDLKAAGEGIEYLATRNPSLRGLLIQNNIDEQLSNSLKAVSSVISLAKDNRQSHGYPTYMIDSYPSDLSKLRAEISSL